MSDDLIDPYAIALAMEHRRESGAEPAIRWEPPEQFRRDLRGDHDSPWSYFVGAEYPPTYAEIASEDA